MSLLNYPIEPRSFEIVRDRICEILTIELPEQANQNTLPYLASKVYKERVTPVDESELTDENGNPSSLVIVKYAQVQPGLQTNLTKDGNYRYYMDVYVKSKQEDGERADTLAYTKLQRLLGVIMGIFQAPQYRKLGFTGFIEHQSIEDVQVADPKNPEDYATGVYGRVILLARFPDEYPPEAGEQIALFSTQALLYDTPLGYLYRGVGQPLPPPPPVPGEWFRNPDWLPLPSVGPGDERFVGLFLVFENEYNQLTIQANIGAANIDWGDGSSEVSISTNIHVYDYSALLGPVSVYKDGRNYKQVIVDCTPLSTVTIFYIDTNTPINSNGGINFVDIAFSWATVTSMLFSQRRKCFILEQLKIYDLGDTVSNNDFNQMYALKSLIFPFEQYTSFVNPSFQGMEVYGDIDLSAATNTSICFSASRIRQIGNIDISSSTTTVRMFEVCFDLLRIGTIDIASCTTIQQMFNTCYKLKEVELINCDNVTSTLSAFTSCRSITKLILQGLTIGFTVNDANMQKAEIDALFTSLGPANGSQTINILRNPGSATADTSIATNKGYTVVI